MKTKLLFTFFFLTTIATKAQESYTFYGNFSYNAEVYEIRIQTDETNKSYKIHMNTIKKTQLNKIKKNINNKPNKNI